MSREMKVGIFFVVGMIILGVLTFYTGSFDDLLKRRYTLHAYFDKVNGLEKQDSVTLAGVEVGEVKKMSIAKDRVEVVLLIDRDARIPKDSVARIENKSLLGGKYVGINMGSPEATPLENGDEIQTEEAADMSAMLQNVADVASDLRAMVDNFNANQDKLTSQVSDILGENRESIRNGFTSFARIMTDNEDDIKATIANLRDVGPQLKQAMESVNMIAKKIERGEGTIGKLVQDDSLYNDMKTLSANLKEASSTLTRVLGDHEQDIGTTLASLKEATPKMQATMDRIDKITQKIENGEGTLGKLVQDDTLYKEATRMLKEGQHAAEDAREQVPIITFTSVIFAAFK